MIGGFIIDSIPLSYSVHSCTIHGSIASITIYGKRANLHAEIIPLAQLKPSCQTLPRAGLNSRRMACGGPRGVSEPPCSFVDVTHQRGTGPHNLSRRHGEAGASPLGPVASSTGPDTAPQLCVPRVTAHGQRWLATTELTKFVRGPVGREQP